MSMPPLRVEARRTGPECVLSVSGDLDFATAPVLRALAAPALCAPAGRLVLDLSGLEFVDAGGVRTLAGLTRAAPPSCEVLVRGASRRIRKVLDILDVSLERPGIRALERATWLVLESQVLVSWARQACAEREDVMARCRKTCTDLVRS